MSTSFELLYNREPRLHNDLENLKLNQPFAQDFKKNWQEAKARIKRVNDQRKIKFDSKYKEKIIEIGDKVRLQNQV